MITPDSAVMDPWRPGVSAAGLSELLTVGASGSWLRYAGEELSVTEGPPEESVPAHGVILGGGVDGAASITAARVRIPAYRPNLTPGFLMLAPRDGDVDGAHSAGPGGINPDGVQWRHYLAGRDPEAATRLWEAVIPALLGTPHRFRVKVLSRADHYPRADAIVVYSAAPDAALVEHTVIETLRARPDLQGLLAESPRSLWSEHHPTGLQRALSAPQLPGRVAQSFVQHRSEAIAGAHPVPGMPRMTGVTACRRTVGSVPARAASREHTTTKGGGNTWTSEFWQQATRIVPTWR